MGTRAVSDRLGSASAVTRRCDSGAVPAKKNIRRDRIRTLHWMAKRKPAVELRTLATLLEPTRDTLYRYVVDAPSAVSRDEAAISVGVSRAMAAFHLDRLVEAGLLRAEYRRLSGRTGRGAGRPAKLYRRSRRRFDVMIPSRDPELLARLLAESIGASTQDGSSRSRLPIRPSRRSPSPKADIRGRRRNGPMRRGCHGRYWFRARHNTS